MTELKKCPCCDSDKVEIFTIEYWSFPTNYAIGCTDCGLSTRDCDTKEEAIYLWNLRGGKE